LICWSRREIVYDLFSGWRNGEVQWCFFHHL
jgi:hypothetical protein